MTDYSWDWIFKRHQELIVKFEAVEKQNGLLLHDAIPVDLDSKKGQASLRVTAWRITEEVAEAIAADYRMDRISFKEEVADVLSFLIEMMILCGIPASDLDKKFYTLGGTTSVEEDRDAAWLDFILELGTTMNYLKNKPWSLKEKPLIAKKSFHEGMIRTFRRFLAAAKENKITEAQLMESYVAKNIINHERLLKDLPV